MPERRVNCKKQIVRNINHNRMPERRENCKKLLTICFLQFTLLSGILLWLVLLTICLFLQFSLLSGILAGKKRKL
jgi:hypothetical protein